MNHKKNNIIKSMACAPAINDGDDKAIPATSTVAKHAALILVVLIYSISIVRESYIWNTSDEWRFFECKVVMFCSFIIKYGNGNIEFTLFIRYRLIKNVS